MYLCEGRGSYRGPDRHDQIVHASVDCPVCAAIEERNDLDEKLRAANEKMMELDSTIESLQKQLAELQAVENVNER